MDDYLTELERRTAAFRRAKEELEQARRDFETTFLLMDGAKSYVVQAGWILN